MRVGQGILRGTGGDGTCHFGWPPGRGPVHMGCVRHGDESQWIGLGGTDPPLSSVSPANQKVLFENQRHICVLTGVP